MGEEKECSLLLKGGEQLQTRLRELQMTTKQVEKCKSDVQTEKRFR